MDCLSKHIQTILNRNHGVFSKTVHFFYVPTNNWFFSIPFWIRASQRRRVVHLQKATPSKKVLKKKMLDLQF
jgi:hypothetical protein